MRVLVTGAAGFVGPHVQRALAERGHEVLTDTESRASGLDLVDEGLADTLISDGQPDAVVHLAARVDPGEDPWRVLFRNNQLATFRVIESVRRLAPRARVLIASSSAVYGPVPRERNPVRETEPTRPVTMYGASKAATEAIAFACAASGVRITVCRPFNIIGPGGDKRSALAHWTRKLRELDRPGSDGVFRCGPLHTYRDLTDVRDVARAYAAILEHDDGDAVLNICSGHAVEGAHVLDLLFSAAGVRPIVVAAPARVDDIAFQSGDPTRLVARTGWSPIIPLEQTIGDVLREHRHTVSV